MLFRRACSCCPPSKMNRKRRDFVRGCVMAARARAYTHTHHDLISLGVSVQQTHTGCLCAHCDTSHPSISIRIPNAPRWFSNAPRWSSRSLEGAGASSWCFHLTDSVCTFQISSARLASWCCLCFVQKPSWSLGSEQVTGWSCGQGGQWSDPLTFAPLGILFFYFFFDWIRETLPCCGIPLTSTLSSSPFVLGSRMGGSPGSDRFVVSHSRETTQGRTRVGNQLSPLLRMERYEVVEERLRYHCSSDKTVKITGWQRLYIQINTDVVMLSDLIQTSILVFELIVNFRTTCGQKWAHRFNTSGPRCLQKALKKRKEKKSM